VTHFQPLANFSWKHHPTLCHPERTRISYFTALSAATYAALPKESRMKSTEATVIDRKSGGAEGPALTPETAVEGAVLDGFRNVAYGNLWLCVEICDGAGDFQYPVVGARAQTLLLHGAFKQPLRLR
jgi:hypothetical protein